MSKKPEIDLLEQIQKDVDGLYEMIEDFGTRYRILSHQITHLHKDILEMDARKYKYISLLESKFTGKLDV